MHQIKAHWEKVVPQVRLVLQSFYAYSRGADKEKDAHFLELLAFFQHLQTFFQGGRLEVVAEVDVDALILKHDSRIRGVQLFFVYDFSKCKLVKGGFRKQFVVPVVKSM